MRLLISIRLINILFILQNYQFLSVKNIIKLFDVMFRKLWSLELIFNDLIIISLKNEFAHEKNEILNILEKSWAKFFVVYNFGFDNIKVNKSHFWTKKSNKKRGKKWNL